MKGSAVHALDDHRVQTDDRDALNREVAVREMVDGPLGFLVRVVGTDRPTLRQRRKIHAGPNLRECCRHFSHPLER